MSPWHLALPSVVFTLVLFLGDAIAEAKRLAEKSGRVRQEDRGEGMTNEVREVVPWSQMRSVAMKGDIRIFWNVVGKDVREMTEEAVKHGFERVRIINSYADYPGKQKENIQKCLKGHSTNPWRKPDFFEKILRRNIGTNSVPPIFVHDIEFVFEQDPKKAWDEDQEAVKASGAKTYKEFESLYYKEWASWFALPCKWAKEMLPDKLVGIYGIQPFRRDFHGIQGKSAEQIDGTHFRDPELWQHVDPYVDFYISSIYCFYDTPASVYYMAANIEENYLRTRRYGNKPVFAYEMMLYHPSNKNLKGTELDAFLVEAMAVIPYFCGGKAVVLWGGMDNRGGVQPYKRLPVFMKSAGRVADLSDKISQATLIIDEPAHGLWKKKKPLVRKLKVSDEEWIVLATNPWQGDAETSSVGVDLGGREFRLEISGRHSEIYHIEGKEKRRISAYD